MQFEYNDFNGAEDVFGDGVQSEAWDGIASMLGGMPVFLQPSDQRGKIGEPIFDPKASNEYLTREATRLEWHKVPVPAPLVMFGKDWDAGKGSILAEWQFSNYPFLWNNVIRSEAIFKSETRLPGLAPIEALIVVTKSGLFPASNSTLYFEQACAQVAAVVQYETFAIPIRVVGLSIDRQATAVDVTWTTYAGRTSRTVASADNKRFRVLWGTRPSQYGVRVARFLDLN
ncbi:MAG: restriction endonuclease [Acidimicrobiia bacterium]|nr:restriction endonuclease [Acidimicrobiia bacterium]